MIITSELSLALVCLYVQVFPCACLLISISMIFDWVFSDHTATLNFGVNLPHKLISIVRVWEHPYSKRLTIPQFRSESFTNSRRVPFWQSLYKSKCYKKSYKDLFGKKRMKLTVNTIWIGYPASFIYKKLIK